MKKLIIEARLNEMQPKQGNPNTPYTAAEIAADSIACAEAGAAVVHFHARHADGSESHEADHYREAIGTIRAATDVLIHTTLGLFRETDPVKRMAHIEALSRDPNLRPDIAPLDMGSNNVDFWDPASRTIGGRNFVYVNYTEDLRTMAARLLELGIKPQLSFWSIPNIRLAAAFAASGIVREPMYALCYLAGETFLAGHPATSAGLRAFADNLPPGAEWSVKGSRFNLLEMVPEILALGGHVSIGLGDDTFSYLGQPTNAELADRVASIARTMGREVASPAEAREMLGL